MVEKNRADRIYQEAEGALDELRVGRLKATELWYSRGQIANRISLLYEVSPNEEEFYWLMFFDCSHKPVPQRAVKDGLLRNDFWVAAFLAQNYSLNKMEQLGAPWAVWQEVFGSRAVKNDTRVAEWIVDYLLSNHLNTRDDVRPVLKRVGERLRFLNTTILDRNELIRKLNEVRINHSL